MANGIGNYPGAYVYPEMMPYQPPQPAPMAQQADMSAMMGLIIPLLTTLPALRNSKANTQAIQTALSQITIPADLLNAPTAADFNNLKGIVANVKTALQSTVTNDQAVFSQFAQAMIFQMSLPMMAGGGVNGMTGMMLVVMMLALGGTLGI